MMSEKHIIKIKYLHVLWTAVFFAILVLVMSLLECELATPAF